MRRLAPHLLDEREEALLAAREPAAAEAWAALHDRVSSTVSASLEGSSRTIDELFAYLADPRAGVRRRALAALHGALRPHLATIAHCYDTVVADRLIVDELRRYDGPRHERDLENELPGDLVDGMLAAVEAHARIVRDWLAAKADLLGVERVTLADHDAPVGDPGTWAYEDAIALVARSFAAVAPALGDAARRLADEARVDAEPRPGKAGNAFCVQVARDVGPYVLVNYAGRLGDVTMLAHEIGHGVHYLLAARRQTPLSFDPPPALAEVPPMFTELVALDRLAGEVDGDRRRAVHARRLEAFLGVFRQTVLTRFEEEAYRRRALGEPLLPHRLDEIWIDLHGQMYGDALDLSAGSPSGWATVPHFVHGRFYNYAYVFAYLVALSLRARLRELGDEFGPSYVEFLQTGGSAGPLEQLAALGIDVGADGWEPAFAELRLLLAAV
jgi:oligoendopeptidase F